MTFGTALRDCHARHGHSGSSYRTFDRTRPQTPQKIADNPAHTLALSPFILGEVGKALAYPRVSAALGITPDEIHRHIDYLRRICRLVESDLAIPVVLNDPKDDPIVYAAVGAGANVQCTRDHDFYAPNVITFCRRYGVEIMDDVQLIALLGA